MTLPNLIRASSMQARRVQRFVDRQAKLQRRSSLRKSIIFLLGSVLIIRLLSSPPPTIRDKNNNSNSNKKLNPPKKETMATQATPPVLVSNDKASTNNNESPPDDEPSVLEQPLALQDIVQQQNKDDDTPQEERSSTTTATTPDLQKDTRILVSTEKTLPLSTEEEQRQLQSQTFHYEKAKREQEEFCQQWKARLDATDPENLPPLVPSALEQVLSLFHDDQSFWMEVYPKDDIVSNFVLDAGSWEKEKTQRMAQWLRNYAEQMHLPLENVTFVDIGANVGWYTFALADLGVNVVAVEPLAANVELMRRSLCRNPQFANRITIHALGLTSPANTGSNCSLFSDRTNVGDGHVVCDNSLKDVTTYESRASQIPLSKVDDVIGHSLPHHHHIAVLKMDTEGYEGHVVAGGPQLFGSGRIPHLQSEFCSSFLIHKATDGHPSPRDLLTSLLRAGYRVRPDILTPEGDSEPFWSQTRLLDEETSPFFAGHLLDVLFEQPVQTR